METIEYEDDEGYISFEYNREKSREEALRLIQLLHARNRVDEELAKLKAREETQEPQKID